MKISLTNKYVEVADMDDEKESAAKKRHRSPNYPAVGLRDAVERVHVLYKKDGRAGSLLEAAVKHFGFSSPHGQAMTIVSAMKKFGLIEDRNSRLIPSPLAIHIIEYTHERERQQQTLQEAVLK